jgi:hypothetical protein
MNPNHAIARGFISGKHPRADLLSFVFLVEKTTWFFRKSTGFLLIMATDPVLGLLQYSVSICVIFAQGIKLPDLQGLTMDVVQENSTLYTLTKLIFGKIQRYTLSLIFVNVNVNVNFQFNDAQLCAGGEDAELTVSSLLALSHQEEEGSADGDSLPPLGKVIRTIHKCRPLIPLFPSSSFFYFVPPQVFIHRECNNAGISQPLVLPMVWGFNVFHLIN